MKNRTYTAFQQLSSLIESLKVSAMRRNSGSLVSCYLTTIAQKFGAVQNDRQFALKEERLAEMVTAVANGNRARMALITEDLPEDQTARAERKASITALIKVGEKCEQELVEDFLFVPVIAALAREGFGGKHLDDMIQDGSLAICMAIREIRDPETNVRDLFTKRVEDALPAAPHFAETMIVATDLNEKEEKESFSGYQLGIC